MSSNEPRDQLAELIADQSIDLRRDIPIGGWPDDEAALYAEMAPEKHTPEGVNWDRQEARRAAIQRLRCEKIAESITSAGWRPPPRVIETIEQLQALPQWTIVRWVSPLANGVIERFDGSWWQPGNDARLDPERIPLPATVLWSPEEER